LIESSVDTKGLLSKEERRETKRSRREYSLDEWVMRGERLREPWHKKSFDFSARTTSDCRQKEHKREEWVVMGLLLATEMINGIDDEFNTIWYLTFKHFEVVLAILDAFS